MSSKNDPHGQPIKAKKGEAVRYHCNYCSTDISNMIRIKCAICADFDLCLECFSVGVEISGHKKTHDYHVMDILNFPLLDPDWGADEELLLLEGIEMYGMSNWGDVSDHLGTKSQLECKAHYEKYYLTPDFLPDLSKCLTTPETLKEIQKNRQNSLAKNGKDTEIPKKSAAKAPAQESRSNYNTHNTAGEYTLHDLAGYMILRGDFETEWDNDAETNLVDCTFAEEDPQEERDLKLKVIEIYNQKLDERQRRKALIKELGLLEYKKLERRKTKEECEVWHRLRPFLRFMKKPEYEEFYQGLVTERNLRRKIEEFKEAREKLGITQVKEMDEYESERNKRPDFYTTRGRKKDSVSTYFLERERGLTPLKPPKPIKKDKEERRGRPKLKRENTPMEIAASQSSELLSPEEKKLASELKLLPQQYISIKDSIIRENLRAGYISKATARQMIKVDVNKTGKIYDFLQQSGWINFVRKFSGSSDQPMKFPSIN